MSEEWTERRDRMVTEQLRSRGLTDERILAAFRKIPRHLFVPEAYRREAYEDHPVPIGEGQTISQPYMVALMIAALQLQGHEKVLEVGTGSGFQTALLSELALEVVSVERIAALAGGARERLATLGIGNVRLRVGDGSLGYPEHAPYDGIIVAAGAPDAPAPLLEQLADAGRCVIPIGSQRAQTLVRFQKRHGRLHREDLADCVFVPLIGGHGWRAEELHD
ncbi:MAG: protein-L-isoaspartate(D-aspartate) O-methyltransferase [Candidatus Omnitrophica bacterium]|nr:protein-L-isoaspartate(D-aspartate) O-methyltransferase [Candidatus Omnitrophota bacterium]